MENSLLFIFIKNIQFKMKSYYKYSSTKKVISKILNNISIYAKNSVFMKRIFKEDRETIGKESNIINALESIMDYFIKKINIFAKKGFRGSKIISLLKDFNVSKINKKMKISSTFQESLTKKVFSRVFEFKVEE